jgi:hypothetical protein
VIWVEIEVEVSAMSIMRANLKHLYQHKAAVLLFAFLALMFTVPVISATTGNNGGAILVVWLVVFYAGLFSGASQVAILAKPFSYCLPGHSGVPVKILSLTCLVVSLVPSAAIHFLSESGSSPMRFIALFSTTTSAYWLGVWVTFRFRNWTVAIALFGFVPLVAMYTENNTSIERFISSSWAIIVLLGLGANYCAYKLLRGDGLARRYCGKMWMGAFDAWNRAKLVKFKQIRLQEREAKQKGRGSLAPKVESFFLARVSDRTMGNTAKHIWSGLYRSFAISASARQPWSGLVFLPLLVIFICYMGAGGALIYVMPGLMVVHMSLHIQSPLLISGGRRERFYTALALAVTINTLALVVLLLATAISQLLAPIMPPLTLTGPSRPFTPLNVKLLFIPLLVVPLGFTGSHLFRRHTMLSKLVPAIGIMMFFQFFIVMDIANQSIPITLTMIVMAIVLSWAVFVLLLSFICRRRCLTQ